LDFRFTAFHEVRRTPVQQRGNPGDEPCATVLGLCNLLDAFIDW
jgi:hypothetical protein